MPCFPCPRQNAFTPAASRFRRTVLRSHAHRSATALSEAYFPLTAPNLDSLALAESGHITQRLARKLSQSADCLVRAVRRLVAQRIDVLQRPPAGKAISVAGPFEQFGYLSSQTSAPAQL
jgi:hypothetical protein